MKIVTIVTGLVAMLSVAAAATPAAAHPYDRYAGGGRSFFASLFGPSIARGVVSYPTNQKPGTIIVSTAQRRLYLVLSNGQALSYAIAVGAAGYAWSGVNQVQQARVAGLDAARGDAAASARSAASYGALSDMQPGFAPPVVHRTSQATVSPLVVLYQRTSLSRSPLKSWVTLTAPICAVHTPRPWVAAANIFVAES